MSGAPLIEPFILPSYPVLLCAHNNIAFFAVLLYSTSPHSCRPSFPFSVRPHLILRFLISLLEHDSMFSVGLFSVLHIVTSFCVTAVQGLSRLLQFFIILLLLFCFCCCCFVLFLLLCFVFVVIVFLLLVLVSLITSYYLLPLIYVIYKEGSIKEQKNEKKANEQKEKEDILCRAERSDNPVELDLFKNPLINHQFCS